MIPRRAPPTRAKASEQRQILLDVLKTIEHTPKPAVVAFDLDSTLFDNRPRQARILRELGEALGHPLLQRADPYSVDGWSLQNAMKNLGLSSEEAASLYPTARRFWLERFFTSAYCIEDVPIQGAVDFVQRTKQAGALVAYVTGRDASMGPGTIECLRTHSFPLPTPNETILLLKPSPEIKDDDWKREGQRQLSSFGTVAAAFDNEPSHVNLYAQAFPEALVVHLDTDHSGRPIQVFEKIPSIANFSF